MKTRSSNREFSGAGAYVSPVAPAAAVGVSAGRKQGRDAASVVRLLLGQWHSAQVSRYVHTWIRTCSDGRRPLLALGVRECVSHSCGSTDRDYPNNDSNADKRVTLAHPDARKTYDYMEMV